MDFLIQTAWYSIELHGHAMAFHGTASVLQETHGIPWNSTIFHGISWHSMELHHYFMELGGTPWHSMELHGYSMELHGIPWNSMDTPRIVHRSFVEFHGFPSISMELHGGISHGLRQSVTTEEHV